MNAAGQLTTIVIASWAFLGQATASTDSLTAEQWREDLRAFAEQAPKFHKSTPEQEIRRGRRLLAAALRANVHHGAIQRLQFGLC